jgi:hypothetical protein
LTDARRREEKFTNFRKAALLLFFLQRDEFTPALASTNTLERF